MKKKAIYLDYAAATPIDKRVLKAMQPYFSKAFYNPSAIYLAGKANRKALDNARADVAKCLGAKPAEIVFTAGATEANNLAIQGVMKAFPQGKLLVSAVEHESVAAPAELFKAQKIPVDKGGVILLNKLSNLISDDTVLISIMLVNNEIGSLQPLREAASIIKTVREERRKKGNDLPLCLHTDAAQAGNYIGLQTSRLGVDLLSINGGKIYGPKQTGALFVRTGVQIMPLILGGGQEFGLRSGTENLAGAVGLAKAFCFAQENCEAEAKRVSQLRDLFVNEIRKCCSDAIINSGDKHTAPHIVSITFFGLDNERLMMQLDEAGVMCAVGSACSAASDEPSHVLSAIGLSKEQAHSTLRFSLGRFSSKSDICKVAKLLGRFIAN